MRALFATAILLALSLTPAADSPGLTSPGSPNGLGLSGFECSATPRRELLREIPPVAGEKPVWVYTAEKWYGGDERYEASPAKTLWVTWREVKGDLVVTGRRLGGPEQVRFIRGGENPPQDKLVVRDAHRVDIIPGGAPREMIRRYAFHGSNLIYPRPGCWELTARLGDAEVRTVHHLTPANEASH